jgi:hypothetical protein
MPKTIILNQATLHPSYQDVDDIAHLTWGSTQNPDVIPIHYYGKYNGSFNLADKFDVLPNDGEVIMSGNNIMVIGTYDESYPTDHPRYSIIPDARNEKFILALEYCLKNFEFDYIQRICNTTYVDVEKMQIFFSTLPKTHVYNGARNLYNYEIPFVAGHNVFMSYDVVKMLVEHKEEYLASSYPEDLIAGKIIMYDTKYVNFDDHSQANTGTTILNEVVEDIQIHPSPEVFSYRIGRKADLHKRLHELILQRDKN